MDVLCLPLLNSFAQLFPGAAKLADQAEDISRFWQASSDSSSGSGNYSMLLSSSLEELKAELVNQTNDQYEKLVGTTMGMDTGEWILSTRDTDEY